MKPFDLEAAKRGEPIQMRCGTKVKFIAHVPEADIASRVIYLADRLIQCAHENGRFYAGNKDDDYRDIFMVPKTRKVWVNFYDTGCQYFASQMVADASIYATSRIGGKAYPVEIDDE